MVGCTAQHIGSHESDGVGTSSEDGFCAQPRMQNCECATSSWPTTGILGCSLIGTCDHVQPVAGWWWMFENMLLLAGTAGIHQDFDLHLNQI